MNIEEQIQQLSNPQEFTKLCNAVFTAKHGTDYQAVDGTRADGGNDGYIIPERTLLAFYCPMKPTSMTDTKYRRKIHDDLKKAAERKKVGALEIERWMLVTPRKLSNDVVEYLSQEAQKQGLKASTIDSTFLAQELWLRPHLRNEFPWLKVVDVDETLKTLVEQLGNHAQGFPKKASSKSEFDVLVPSKGAASAQDPDFAKVVVLLKTGGGDEARTSLRTIFYRTTNQIVKLNALIGLLQFYDPVRDNPQEMIGLGEYGIQIADSLKATGAKAIFLAHKGKHLAEIFSREDAETAIMIKAGNLLGAPLVSETQRQQVLDHLHRLDDQSGAAFQEACRLAAESREAHVVAYVIMKIGEAAGLRFIHLDKLGAKERALREKLVCKVSYGVAKDLYASIGYERGVAFALHNLANDLRFFGEVEEAKVLTQQVVEMARKMGDAHLLDDAHLLMRRLTTGRVPDYVHGEHKDSV